MLVPKTFISLLILTADFAVELQSYVPSWRLGFLKYGGSGWIKLKHNQLNQAGICAGAKFRKSKCQRYYYSNALYISDYIRHPF